MKDPIRTLIQTAIQRLVDQQILTLTTQPHIQLERSKNKNHGDLASNIAMTLAKSVGKPPRELAQLIIDNLPRSSDVSRVEIAGPGFINFFLEATASSAIIMTILTAKQAFGCSQTGAQRKAQVEFVSANPTGPLHVGHGRGGIIGDTICRLLAASGWSVSREFYYNDAGEQIHQLALSVQARCQQLAPGDEDWPPNAYHGDYIIDVAHAYIAKQTICAADKQVTGMGNTHNLSAIREFSVAFLRREQDLDLKAFDISFDHFVLESALYTAGKVEYVVQRLIERGKTYEKDGALWLKTSDYGDDKDRVMRKQDGSYTYFVPDIAYHVDKWQRGYKTVINELGADHHSTITRVRAGLQALDIGIPHNWPHYVLHQMVAVVRGGKEVKISKRAGNYVTLRDLIDEVGRDATRYFLAARAPSSQLTFDIDLACSQSHENPVFYIQYAHARICSVIQKFKQSAAYQSIPNADEQTWLTQTTSTQLMLLSADAEKVLMKKLADYPEHVSTAAQQLEPHHIAHYLYNLAADFHHYYNSHTLLVENTALCQARLALSEAVRQVISNGLGLLGVSAPNSM